MAGTIPAEPFKLAFEGYDADAHRADAVYIGQSLQGTARTYNSIINWHFQGKPVAPQFQSIKVHVGTPERGSLFYLLYMMMVHGKMAVYPEIFFELASLSVPLVFKGIISRLSGQSKVVETVVNAMLEMDQRHHEFAMRVQADHMKLHADHVADKAQLFAVIEKLALNNKKPLADMAIPVGKTVKLIEHFKDAPEPVVVDEPIAEALRSKEEAVVGDVQNFVGKFVAIDVINATGKLLLEGSAKPVAVKITDPVISIPENVYTHALDLARDVQVSAKPVSKGGSIATLYVSDAHPKGER